jgi:GAF domain-containing protein
LEKRRSWSSTGMAQIGEILRADYAKVGDLYDKIVKFVVTYTEGNQGSLFLLQQDSTQQNVLNLVSAYAFDRKKYQQKSILPGEGLVGQTFLEKSTTLMKVIPRDYVKITSGLGDAPPTALLIVPLKINDVVYGVLELASFTHYEKYQIELIEKFAESIASTSANVEVNERTRALLQQTQQQAEELKAAEEEMRQNMEELSATQEEMSRKEREYVNRIEELESRLHIATARQGASLDMESEPAYKMAV